jgi:hypothetical protein
MEMGVNLFELRAVSFAGHETVQTVTVTRQGEVPEYVEEGRYWNRYYYDEDGRSWHVYFQEGENPAFVKPSDDSDEVVRSYMLGIIDEALLEASKDTPDYIEPGENRIHFQNSISLQTLRYIIENAEMHVQLGVISFMPNHPVFLIDGKEVKWADALYCEYPEGTWWMGKTDSRYVSLLNDYISQIKKDGEGFGLHV